VPIWRAMAFSTRCLPDRVITNFHARARVDLAVRQEGSKRWTPVHTLSLYDSPRCIKVLSTPLPLVVKLLLPLHLGEAHSLLCVLLPLLWGSTV
jgi:hypothetical protein